MKEKIDYKWALGVLSSHQKWRLGCNETPPTEPKELTEACNTAIKALEAMDRLQGLEEELNNVDKVYEKNTFTHGYIVAISKAIKLMDGK